MPKQIPINKTKAIFQHQQWHLLALLVLLACSTIFIQNVDTNYTTLFWFAISIPIIHQIYVLLMWRYELYYESFTSRFGFEKAFGIYKVGFAILFVSRLLVLIPLAYLDANSLDINPYLAYGIALLITPPVIYLFYSVKKYFTIDRAFGIDHFDKTYDVPFVKQGIFRFTNNGMYIYGLMILFLPALLWLSKLALFVALFNYIYIWVHYYTVEKPDMEYIYGETPSK